MMLKVDFVKNKRLKQYLEHGLYLAILFILIPGFYYFELCIVLPTIVKEWTVEYCIHFICATFLLFNIVGNLMFGSCTDTSIKGRIMIVDSVTDNDKNWSFCAVCECLRPPRAWHCDYCNICILKRDHHCTFFASCVGYYNHRYFMLFTFHVFIAMLYAFYYNVQFLAQFLTWNHGLVFLKFVFPLASFFIDFGYESIYIFLVVINIVVALFTGFLFFYHLNNILIGKTVPETKHYAKEFLYDKGWKLNLVEVFGTRWYLTWILPFIHSPLPGNGIEWTVDDKSK